MRECGLIVAAGLASALLGAGFGWIIGTNVPEFIQLLFGRFVVVESPVGVATVLGAINGLWIGAAAMAVGLLVAALRVRNAP
jgi:hypothetical protein